MKKTKSNVTINSLYEIKKKSQHASRSNLGSVALIKNPTVTKCKTIMVKKNIIHTKLKNKLSTMFLIYSNIYFF